jgi:hypothetical protein
MNTARYVRSYMDQELISAVPLEEPDDFLTMELCRNAYVMDVMKFDTAIVFLISDGSMQVGAFYEKRSYSLFSRSTSQASDSRSSSNEKTIPFTSISSPLIKESSPLR